MINYFIPILVMIIIIYGIYKKVDIFDTFIIGVKEGMKLSINLFPILLSFVVIMSSSIIVILYIKEIFSRNNYAQL